MIRNKTLTAWTDGWFDRVPPRKQNLVLFLCTPAAERLLPDIHAYRRAIVAGLRYQYVRHIGSERFGAVITTLLETGPEARDLWGRHEIVLPPLDRAPRGCYWLQIVSAGRRWLRAGPGGLVSLSVPR